MSFSLRVKLSAIEAMGDRMYRNRLYPNPADNDLYISESKTGEFLGWKLLSISGLVIEAGIGNHIDVSRLSAGMYLLQIQGNGAHVFIKK
jgi:hypothetical protein